jgi:type II secretory pathway pseudopilin PulG
MKLERQGGGGEDGYAMAALLVMLSIMAILMTAAMPVWRQQAQREKEEELVWRGQQYVRAIRLYQAKNQAFPPSIDMLVDGRFIRKKYKDPITDDDFAALGAASAPGVGSGAGSGQAGLPAGVQQELTKSAQRGQQGGSFPGQSGQPGTAFPGQPGQPGGAFPGAPPVGGVIGVASKSKAESIRAYQGRTHYNEWAFVFVNTMPGGRGGVPGAPGLPGLPGGRGGQAQPGMPQPGGRGRSGQPGFPGGGRGPGGVTIPSIEGGFPQGPTAPSPFPGRGGRGGGR